MIELEKRDEARPVLISRIDHLIVAAPDLDEGVAPRLVTWVAKGRGLESLVSRVGGYASGLGSVHSGGCELVDLRAEHPDVGRVREMLNGLELGLQVESGPAPALIATIRTPRGTVELR